MLVFFQQLFARFLVIGVQWNAIDRTYIHALRRFIVTHAFRAKVRIDDIDFITLGYRAIGALGFANITIDAFVGYH
jgi:hypothetical protein